MKLMTKAIENKIPRLGETEGKEQIVYVKYFNPCGLGTWYGIEYDPKDKLFFGCVNLCGDWEYGYFSLTELENIKLMFGLGIERDLYFKPTNINDLI